MALGLPRLRTVSPTRSLRTSVGCGAGMLQCISRLRVDCRRMGPGVSDTQERESVASPGQKRTFWKAQIWLGHRGTLRLHKAQTGYLVT